MTDHHEHADSVHPHKTKLKTKRPLSANLLFLIIAATAVLGFLAGTHSEQIMSVVGPAFGFRVFLAGLTTFPKDARWTNAMFSSPLEALVKTMLPLVPQIVAKHVAYD